MRVEASRARSATGHSSAPTAPFVVITAGLAVAPIVRALIVECVDPSADAERRRALGGDGGLVRGEAHDGRRPAAELALLDGSKALKRSPDLGLTHAFSKAEEAERAIRVRGALGDLPDLENCGTNGRSV